MSILVKLTTRRVSPSPNLLIKVGRSCYDMLCYDFYCGGFTVGSEQLNQYDDGLPAHMHQWVILFLLDDLRWCYVWLPWWSLPWFAWCCAIQRIRRVHHPMGGVICWDTPGMWRLVSSTTSGWRYPWCWIDSSGTPIAASSYEPYLYI